MYILSTKTIPFDEEKKDQACSIRPLCEGEKEYGVFVLCEKEISEK